MKKRELKVYTEGQVKRRTKVKAGWDEDIRRTARALRSNVLSEPKRKKKRQMDGGLVKDVTEKQKA